MGQRLNIEIKKKDKVIANCYYHWSGFSNSSLELAKLIIDKFDTVHEENDVIEAIMLLQLTGAGITRPAISYLYKNIPNFDLEEEIKTNNPWGEYKLHLSKGRDEGLIGITEKEMDDTRRWEEGRITIDVTNKTFDFEVFGKTDELYDDLPVKELKDFKYKNIKFEEIDEYIKYIKGLIENDKDGHYYKVDGIDNYIYFIY